ncbi:MAG: hypothetical protein MZU91_11510 [Desulfosudis oleivorans]|nr:hypothetical protein [Desulfosudis oleivorans]
MARRARGRPAARLTTGVGIESLPCVLARRLARRLLRPVRRQHRRLRRPGRRRRPPAADPPSRRRRRSSAGRPTASASCSARTRTSANGLPTLFTVGLDGGFPEALPLPTGRLRLLLGRRRPPGLRADPCSGRSAWKRYQGGQTTPVWIVSLADLKVEKIPRENSNDSNPIWFGDKIYFLSDRKGPVSLFVYDLATKKVAEALPNDGLDFKSASAGPGGIVIEQFGALHLFDPATGTARRVPVALDGDLPEVRPHYAKVGPRIAGGVRLAERGPGRVRGPRRDPDRAGREGRHPQPDPDDRRHGARSRPGRPTASPSPTSRTSRANTPCTSATRPGRDRSRRSPSASRRPSSTGPSGRPTARRSPTTTSA